MGINLKARLRTAARAAVAALVAAGMLAAGAYADPGSGGAGSGEGDGGTGGNANIIWTYKDDDSGSFGDPTNQNVRNAMTAVRPGVWIGAHGGNDPDRSINQALDQAVGECQARGNQECRLVGVGFVWSTDNSFTGAAGGYPAKTWQEAYGASGIPNNTYSHNGAQYRTNDVFSDGTTSVNGLANREMTDDPEHTSVIVIVLGENEPPAAVPPAPPTKAIEEGVSADSMTNRTTITTGTGKGGSKLTIGDRFTPNGINYTVSGMKVTDTTTGEDITSKFSFNTADGATPAGDVLTATWNGGDLPDDHEFALTFDVTVHGPETSKVGDQGYVQWNDEPEASTDSKEFPTWKPNPDKSWIKQDADGNWQAVIDPDETNATGGDAQTYLDGDKVASVVNGTVEAHLIDAPTSLVLTDDWSAADYIWDATTNVGDIRVYEADAETADKSSVADIANTGKDVTDQFDITLEGTKASASAKQEYLDSLKGMDTPKQVTLLIPGVINFANGGGAEQVRADFGRQEGDELTFCADPNASGDPSAATLTNKGSQTVNGQTVETNEPWICGYVPPVEKDVIGEASEGGDQESVDGKVVYPGQKVEYQLLTTPNLPSDLAYGVSKVVFTDSYDKWLEPDKQTVEMMDLTNGKVIAKSKYTTKWDDENHLFQLTVTDQTLIAQWRAGSSPRIQVRFEGTVSKDAPTDHKVNNKWVLTLNNSITPSNEVFNIPPKFDPSKEDNQSAEQGDPTVSIDSGAPASSTTTTTST